MSSCCGAHVMPWSSSTVILWDHHLYSVRTQCLAHSAWHTCVLQVHFPWWRTRAVVYEPVAIPRPRGAWYVRTRAPCWHQGSCLCGVRRQCATMVALVPGELLPKVMAVLSCDLQRSQQPASLAPAARRYTATPPPRLLYWARSAAFPTTSESTQPPRLLYSSSTAQHDAQ